jgi:hypothetical protein
MKEAYDGKHNGETYTFKMTPWKVGMFDEEIVSISAYLKADKNRIVDGTLYVMLED